MVARSVPRLMGMRHIFYLAIIAAAWNLHYSFSVEHTQRLFEVFNTPPAVEERCALNFYGLPRAFSSIVLPTIVENVLKPNVNYSCDVFLHFHALEQEAAGRSGHGGAIQLDNVYELRAAVKNIFGNNAIIDFSNTTEVEFQHTYGDLLDKIRTVNNTDGTWRYRYWLYPEDAFPLATHGNIIKMWHQQQQVWSLMEASEQKHNIQYTRVAMLRNDVAFLTPIDVWLNGNQTKDHDNSVGVMPAFQTAPVNDRLFIGPRRAAEIWATKHFDLLEDYLDEIYIEMPGIGIHSERYLSRKLLPLMHTLGVTTVKDPDLCFGRVRADQSVWSSDCGRDIGRHQEILEQMTGRHCVPRVHKHLRLVAVLDCSIEMHSSSLGF